MARIRQPIPEPRVNHQADIPKENASCAVPMVAWPLTKVPIMAPQTIQAPAFPPPLEKSAAEATFRPEYTPIPTISPMVASIPTTCSGPKCMTISPSLFPKDAKKWERQRTPFAGFQIDCESGGNRPPPFKTAKQFVQKYSNTGRNFCQERTMSFPALIFPRVYVEIEHSNSGKGDPPCNFGK